MKYIIFCLTLSAFCLTACQSDKNQSTEHKNTNLPKQHIIIGEWSKPKIDFQGLDQNELSSDERNQLVFLIGGMTKMFEEMKIVFFDDHATRNSYQISMLIPGEKEPYKEFGEYKLLADGKRLVIHNPDRTKVDIELTELSATTMRWRLQLADLAKFSGGEMDFDWGEEMPNMVMYMTFKKRIKGNEKEEI